jgi:hypothetical protein
MGLQKATLGHEHLYGRTCQARGGRSCPRRVVCGSRGAQTSNGKGGKGEGGEKNGNYQDDEGPWGAGQRLCFHLLIGVFGCRCIYLGRFARDLFSLFRVSKACSIMYQMVLRVSQPHFPANICIMHMCMTSIRSPRSDISLPNCITRDPIL